MNFLSCYNLVMLESCCHCCFYSKALETNVRSYIKWMKVQNYK